MNNFENFRKEYAKSILESSVITAKKRPVIVAKEKWDISDGNMMKRFMLRTSEQRKYFVSTMIDKEQEMQHYAKAIILKKDSVTVVLSSESVAKVTDLDKELSVFLDELHVDAMYINDS
jgi:pterin-4a-carbinolamine dehydratase